MYGMILSMFSSAASNIANSYTAMYQAEAASEINAAQTKINETLTGLSLTTTMNSAQKTRTEITEQARAVEFQVKTEAHAAMGEAKVEAARTGAYGQRVQLAREQKITGAVDRQMGKLKADVDAKQDALIDQRNAAHTKAVSDLIAGPIDISSSISTKDIWTGALMGFSADIYSIYSNHQFQKDAREASATGDG
jgi:hypothetical protein